MVGSLTKDNKNGYRFNYENGAEGIKVLISGRLNGAVRSEMYKDEELLFIPLEQILITQFQKPVPHMEKLELKFGFVGKYMEKEFLLHFETPNKRIKI